MFLQYGTTGYDPGFDAGILALLGAYMLFMFVLLVISYVYMGLTLMKVAQRLKTEPAWLAWIPIGNLYLMSKLAKMHWWPILLILAAIIPFAGAIAVIVLLYLNQFRCRYG